MTIEQRSVSVSAADGILPAQLYISLEHPWSLRIVIAEEELEAHGNDLFGCPRFDGYSKVAGGSFAVLVPSMTCTHPVWLVRWEAGVWHKLALFKAFDYAGNSPLTGLPEALVSFHLLGAARVWVGALRILLDVNPLLFARVGFREPGIDRALPDSEARAL